MKYTGKQNQNQQARIGIIVSNLGTPDAPEPGALRRYLKQFLSDPRIVEFPRALWWLILNGVILRVRPNRSAASYKKIWTDEGSPLAVHTHKLANGLATAIQNSLGDDSIIVDYAMRYGSPSIEDTIQTQLDKGVTRLLVLPLYPQYSCSTTGSTFDAIAADFTRRRVLPDFHFIDSYYHHPQFINALASKVRTHWAQFGKADKLIFSYHGEPQRYVDAGDPYQHHCDETSRLLVHALGLQPQEHLTAFASRFGRQEWLRPYLNETLKKMPSQGVESVQIICPGFAVDCLETLEEIAIENRDYFLEAGGQRYEYIPCLNSDKDHIGALASILSNPLSCWLQPTQNSRE